MDTKVKILVTGDVCGNFNQLFTKVNKTNQKAGPFDMLLCVGDFFGKLEDNEKLIAYKNGAKIIAVPTYILGPTKNEHLMFYDDIEDGEICSNLTYLGKRGLYTLSSGIKIAYLSGIEESKDSNKECCFNKDDIITLRNSCLVSKSSASEYKGVDILLTSQQPFGIQENNSNASKLISFLCKEIKPRYHFCSSNNGSYNEPAPFRIPADQSTQLELSTRFISLANVGNAKEKYIYALNMTPVDKMRVMELIQKTTNETKCPYLGIDFADYKISNENSDKRQYFYDMQAGNEEDRKRRGGGKGNRKEKRPKFQGIAQEKCWFCLSSPDVEKHLVISVGEHFYLALAKGPINDYHVLIMSIVHIQSAALLTEDDWEELTRFKDALRKFFQANNHEVCFTERNYKSSHIQINALGIDKPRAWKMAHSFEDKAEEYNLEFETLPELTSPEMLPSQGPYFVAELPDKTLLTRNMNHFPLHFARDVFCAPNLLDCEDKVNWKDCCLDKNEEIELVKDFREKFKEYDFTL
ncbi:CWF19-like protein 1 homolog, partial [Teleopsis dalmanni]|uniref:CWF19-like protein 1 homolog n=1 Tax=Teleopsis dalmanni TaxID=139649 RepID=UPI0018CFAC9E